MQSNIKLQVQFQGLYLLLLIYDLSRDESDENNCRMLVIRDNYNKKISPFDFDYIKSEVKPVIVNVTLTLMKVLSISEVDGEYAMKFRLRMVWYDYRLRYYNLKRDRSLNSLSRTEIDQIWIPYVVFSNTENSENTKGIGPLNLNIEKSLIKGDDESEVTIERGGNYTESSINIMEEINIFEGDENSIIFQQVYAKKFECVYQLQLYPFDTQVGIPNFQYAYEIFY